MLNATLYFPWRLGSDRTFPLFNFAHLIRSLDPRWVDLLFIARHAGRSELHLVLMAGPGAGATLAEQQLRAALIRLEGDHDFECRFDTTRMASAEVESFHFAKVGHDDLQLPSGKGLAFLLPLLQVAVEQLRQAEVLEVDLAYRVTLHTRVPDAERARSLVPSLAELHERAPQGATHAQLQEAFETLRKGGWHAIEAIGLPSEAVRSHGPWVEGSIRSHLKRCMPFVPDELWELNWDDDAVADEAAGVAAARQDLYLDQVFASLLPPADARHPARPRATGHTRSMVDSGPFAFVSYAHGDRAFMEQVVGYLTQQRLRCWVDDSIEPGAIWDETLEERIRRSRLVLACHSPAYEASRYCRRELKFADMLSKTIIPVSLRRATWGPGLSLMFQELQIHALDHDRAWSELGLRMRAGLEDK